ncbi:hypothetical protein F7734_57135 [Scytonema sp. UIC 10036]|uniref:hypothetical protein n=1 Tax=Scytonema sp. UIC 10036 TaxID=2304196 RepID=UPI0012DA965D|nr:hypothetical protein [Scytonema sp. UIC 10036]MUH01299.1 hypothetical protein [Scytonema sp. UIC 10036]
MTIYLTYIFKTIFHSDRKGARSLTPIPLFNKVLFTIFADFLFARYSAIAQHEL